MLAWESTFKRKTIHVYLRLSEIEGRIQGIKPVEMAPAVEQDITELHRSGWRHTYLSSLYNTTQPPNMDSEIKWSRTPHTSAHSFTDYHFLFLLHYFLFLPQLLSLCHNYNFFKSRLRLGQGIWPPGQDAHIPYWRAWVQNLVLLSHSLLECSQGQSLQPGQSSELRNIVKILGSKSRKYLEVRKSIYVVNVFKYTMLWNRIY